MASIYYLTYGDSKKDVTALTTQTDLSGTPADAIGIWIGSSVSLSRHGEIRTAFERCLAAARENEFPPLTAGVDWLISRCEIGQTKDQVVTELNGGTIPQTEVGVFAGENYPKVGGARGATFMFDPFFEKLFRNFQEFTYQNNTGNVA